jgi:hypothetical protein
LERRRPAAVGLATLNITAAAQRQAAHLTRHCGAGASRSADGGGTPPLQEAQ